MLLLLLLVGLWKLLLERMSRLRRQGLWRNLHPLLLLLRGLLQLCLLLLLPLEVLLGLVLRLCLRRLVSLRLLLGLLLVVML